MSEKLDKCYELIVKLSREAGQVGVPNLSIWNILTNWVVFNFQGLWDVYIPKIFIQW
jgi:hypothetical protein